MKLKLVFTAVAAAVLVACGGGGGGGGGFSSLPMGSVAPPDSGSTPAPSPAPSPAPAPAAAARTYMYEALSPAADKDAFLGHLNAEGARSFRFLTSLAFVSGQNVSTVETYVKDGSASYVYELLDTTTNRSAFQAQLDAQGARGFRWAGSYAVGGASVTLYRKEDAGTYSYVLTTASSSSAGFLQEANAQGANGYLNLAPGFMVGTETVAIYEKGSAGGARYAYEFPSSPGSDADLLAQLNGQGARGFRFRSPYSFSDRSGLLYVQDGSQSSTFSFSALDPADGSAKWMEQVNAQGAQGHGLIGDYMMPSGQAKNLFFAAANCAGELCNSTSLFGR